MPRRQLSDAAAGDNCLGPKTRLTQAALSILEHDAEKIKVEELHATAPYRLHVFITDTHRSAGATQSPKRAD
eukprot:6201775-Pleurochrysis_carterae.AAC.2